MSAPNPSRRELLAAAAAAPLLTTLGCEARDEAPQARAPQTPPRPEHVIVLVADDNSRVDLGCYGNPDCHTPNIDALAAQGLRFRRAYTPVGICKPSRAAMYTGLYPHKNGATGFTPIRDDVATWTELLKPEVCATGMIGKLNVEPVAKFRFEKWLKPREIGGARDTAELEAAFGEMLDGFAGRRMALVVNLKDPHRPLRPPYDTPECMPTPVPHDPSTLSVPPSLWDTPGTRGELALYYDAIWRLDCTVGRLMAALDARGLRDDTLVVLTSDNGQPFPFAKTTLYEAGINLPFIVRWPRAVPAGGASDALVSLVDVLPTVLDAFGVASPVPLDGASLLPLLRGEVASVRDAIVGEHTEGRVGAPTPSRSLREARFKYIRNFNPENQFDNNIVEHSETWRSWAEAAPGDPVLAARMHAMLWRPPEELYDLERDPFELANLAADAAHAEDLARLRARLREWMRASGDPLYDG